MTARNHLAIIGSGASAIYLLKHLLDHADVLKDRLESISIFEKTAVPGMGMPYSPQTTDRFNMSNISSEEVPALTISFADWLRSQDAKVLKELDLEGVEISDSEVYSRLALGRYLNSQYREIVAALPAAGISVREFPGCEISDVRASAGDSCATLTLCDGTSLEVDQVVIATGHRWPEKDNPSTGYYASPWPISKLLPEKGQLHNFAIGTLGASLSAFDVVASLSHRHGDFLQSENGLAFRPFPGTEDFKIVMHSAQGLLPHLQFDQVEPFREIYRHVDRDGLLALLTEDGYLRIETFFNKVCRPALSEAFEKDGMPKMVTHLADPAFGLADFVEEMTVEHDFADAFEGMRFEMIEARDSVLNHKPIHWKEVIDDLFYTLNFHAELMPAEDHLTLRSLVMPFLMNVIAAMPLPSADTMLALHDAGKLEIVSGNVSIPEEQPRQDQTLVEIKNGEEVSTVSYRMFIDCSGQKPLELEDYPFQGLVEDGSLRQARASFVDPAKAVEALPVEKREHVFKESGAWLYPIGGIDIDAAYRLIGNGGEASERIFDIAFPHTSGIRPYSYGLQACNTTSAILVTSWVEQLSATNGPTEISKIYEEI